MSTIKITNINLTNKSFSYHQWKSSTKDFRIEMKEVYKRAPKWNEDQEAGFEEKGHTAIVIWILV